MKFEEFKKTYNKEARMKNEQRDLFTTFCKLPHSDKASFLYDSGIQLGKVALSYDAGKSQFYIKSFRNPFTDELIIKSQERANNNFYGILDFDDDAIKPEDLFELEIVYFESSSEPAEERPVKVTEPVIEVKEKPVDRRVTGGYVSKKDILEISKEFTKNSRGNDVELLDLPVEQRALLFTWRYHLEKTGKRFEGFYHYTNITNLKSILDIGYLLSRNMVDNLAYDSASHEVLERTPEWVGEYARLFYFPRPPFLYKVEGIKRNCTGPHMPIPVALEFDIQTMVENDVVYLDGSAGNIIWKDHEYERTRYTTNPMEASGFRWDIIFHRGPLPTYQNGVGDIYGETNHAYITIRRGAELLVKDGIDLKHLKRILFRTKAELEFAKQMVGNDSRMQVDPDKFHLNNEFLVDWNVEPDNDNNLLNVWIMLLHGNAFVSDRELVVRYDSDNVVYKSYNIIDGTPENLLDEHDVIRLPNMRRIEKLEYYINGILSAIWKKEDIND